METGKQDKAGWTSEWLLNIYQHITAGFLMAPLSYDISFRCPLPEFLLDETNKS